MLMFEVYLLVSAFVSLILKMSRVIPRKNILIIDKMVLKWPVAFITVALRIYIHNR